MAHFVFATYADHAHIGPLVPVSRALVERDHQVTWYTGENYRAAVERSGADFAAPVEGRFIDGRELEQKFPESIQMSARRRARWLMDNHWVPAYEGQYRDLVAVVDRTRADVLLADASWGPAKLVHAVTGVLWATISQMPILLPDPAVPPIGTGWKFGTSPFHRLRNRIGNRLINALVHDPGMKKINAFWNSIGVPVSREVSESPYLFMQAGTRSLEYPRALPQQMHFIGRLEPDSPMGVGLPSWWGELDGDRPVVLVTQGTMAVDADDLIRPALRGLAGDQVLVVATTGREGVDLGYVPDNARVASFLPYRELMPKLAAVVTNGGFGTVQQALSHGLPLVVAGRSEDKTDVCARVAWSGAGVDLRTRRPSPQQVAGAVKVMSTDPRYRQAAQRLAVEYAEYDACGTAVKLLERLATTRRPVIASR
ncbi:glycosyltransferase [Saccharopolyspora pogona]|uniref:glycosyltransferase n=1 Tax=Saccharopolyspora pogona TaxID=333966 RepID=UPI0016898599|nr:nucleotide disphospho-sugar-binding domain-containing protein [Saccharopolyspora pogona]